MQNPQTPAAVIGMLGARARDKVTGFAGVITSVCFDLYGCTQVLVHPGLKPDGSMADQTWFDANRIEMTVDADGRVVRAMESPHNTGGSARSMLDNGPAEKPRFTKA